MTGIVVSSGDEIVKRSHLLLALLGFSTKIITAGANAMSRQSRQARSPEEGPQVGRQVLQALGTAEPSLEVNRITATWKCRGRCSV